MTILAGSKLKAADLTLPDEVAGYSGGTNTITATTFTDLPTNACAVSITNPHPTADMLVAVHCGHWINLPASAAFTRTCPRVSGSITIAAGVTSVGGGHAGWGMVCGSNVQGNAQHSGYATYTLPPGTATFTMQAYKDSAAAGTHQVNYSVIQITPLRYLF
jgi:hypothetical protein